MLQNMREKLKGTTAVILVGILIIPFAFFGVDSLFLSGGAVEEAASVEGEGITELEVQRGVEMRRRQLLDRYEDMDPSMLSDERLRAPVLDQLIRQQLLALTARGGGMAVAEQTFHEIVRNSEAFQSGGKFDPQVYEFALSRLGYTPRSYREEVTEELLANQVRAGVQAGSVLTESEVGTFARLTLQERSFDYLSIPVADLTDEVDVTEGEIRAWYQENSERFSVPRRVVVEGIELTPELLSQQVEVEPEAVRERFEQEREAAREAGTSWQLAHIMVEVRDDGSHEEILASIRNGLESGESFASLAETYSEDPGSASQGGELGTFTPDSLPEGFQPVLEELDEGDVSEPTRIGDAFHIIKVLNAKEPDLMLFSEQRERLKRELRLEKAREMMPEYADRLRDETYTAERLERVADSLGLPLRVTEPFSREGGDEGIARHPTVVQAAFSEEVLEEGYASQVLELEDDHYVVIKLREEIPAHQQPLEEVRDRIAERLRQQKARQLAVARAEELLGAVRESGKQEAVAGTGLEWQSARNVTRFERTPDGALVQAVYAHPPAADLPVSGTAAGGSQAFVYVLQEIDSGTLEALAADERKSLRRALYQMLATRELQAYTESLEAAADIEK